MRSKSDREKVGERLILLLSRIDNGETGEKELYRIWKRLRTRISVSANVLLLCTGMIEVISS